MRSTKAILATLGCALALLACSSPTTTKPGDTVTGSVVHAHLPKPSATPTPKKINVDNGEGGNTGTPSPSPSSSTGLTASPSPSPSASTAAPANYFARVLGSDGKPAAGVTVTGYPVPAATATTAYRMLRWLLDTATGPQTATTGADGTFKLVDPTGNPLNLEAVQSDTMKAFQANVKSDTKGLDMTLEKVGSITGALQLDGGGAAAGVTVSIPGTAYTVLTDATGNYTIANVAPGTYTVLTHKAGLADVSITNVSVSSGAPATIDTKTLTGVVPTISSVTPANAGPGAAITIKGANFASGQTIGVTIGGKAATNVARVDDNTLTATISSDAVSGKLIATVGAKASAGVDFVVLGAFSVSPPDVKKLLQGATQQYTYTGLDSSGTPLTNAVGTWSAAPASVITVDAKGLVTAVGAGDGTLTISSGTTKADFPIHVDPQLALTTIAGGATAGAADGTGGAATFNLPTGVALDNAGNLWVADNNNNAIRKIVLSSGAVTTVAGKSGTQGVADGTGAAASFVFPESLLFDATNNVVDIADQAGYRIRKMTPAGVVTTFAGGGPNGPDVNGTYLDANGTSARFYAPGWLAQGADGTLYVSDTYNHCIRKISPTGAVTTLAGDPTNPGSNGGGFADDKGTKAKFSFPGGLVVDPNGVVYVADTGNNRIRKVMPDGSVSTVAGGSPGAQDGSLNVAQFNGPIGLAFDAKGNLIVSDENNNSIRKCTPLGDVTTLIANGKGFADGAQGKMDSPQGIAVDTTKGILYIADANNNRIRSMPLP